MVLQNPFATPPDKRVPARRFRGRLASPVTVWTAGGPQSRTGLTVSSLALAEGDPSLIVGLVNDTTPLYDTIVETERFVVHVLDASARRVAEVFAGLFPSPGGIFSGVKFHDGHYGPLLDDFPNRALCRLQRIDEAGFQRIVRGVVDEFEVAVAEDPLVYFRGRFRTLSGGD